MKRTVVVMEQLSDAFRQSCARWYTALPSDVRLAVDTWLAANPLPSVAPASDLAIYAYCEAPGTIDPWILCRIAAEDVTPAWIASRTPLVEALPSGAMQSQFRESELWWRRPQVPSC